MDTFDHLLNWKLKVGSHAFPSKDGGTCINEAALVAAGFEYKPICAPDDMPDCFSRPICQLAMYLNDNSTDQERQRLLPYVTRLACADTPAVEKTRSAFIWKHVRNYHYFGVPFDEGLDVLEGVLAIGRQADPLGPDEARTRMDTARAGQSTSAQEEAPASSVDKPLLSKVKSWLTLKEIEPTA